MDIMINLQDNSRYNNQTYIPVHIHSMHSYDVMQRLSRLPKFCTSEAKLLYNAPKNRFANILPCKLVYGISYRLRILATGYSKTDDCSRVKLAEIEEEEGSDYINANHLDVRNYYYTYIFIIHSLVYF